MNDTMKTRCEKIISRCLQVNSKNPIEIFNAIATEEYIRIHGPEHHILDGAAIMTAYHNAGGAVN